MRIALVSTQRTAVPPVKTGSVELLVGLLAREFTQEGHEVTVFAPGDSTIQTRIMSVLPTGYQHDETIWDWQLAEFMQMGRVYEHADEFDVIHSHVYCYALPFSRLVKTPTVHTFHICPTPDFVRYCRMYPQGHYTLLSEFQRQFFEDVPIEGVVHNGVDISTFPFSPHPGKYLAFLGDLRADKGPLEAITCAQNAGIPIQIAGPPTEYFLNVIKPLVNGSGVEYVGELNHTEKVAFLKDALALIFPGTALEACPMVLIESMACGTPVLALGRGPVPELITQNISGIYVDDYPDMVNAIGELSKLDRSEIRKLAVGHFDVKRMAGEYMNIYERVQR